MHAYIRTYINTFITSSFIHTYINELTHLQISHSLLVFDPRGRLYISIGSASNVDKDSRRARLRRFDLPHPRNGSIVDFTTGEVSSVCINYTCTCTYV